MRVAWLAALVALGCAGPPLARIPDCPGVIPDAATLPGGDFLVRERVRVEAPGIELALEIVAERRGARLVVVGFDAFGARALSVVQNGSDVESDARYAAALPIGPATLLRDLHAAARLAPGAPEREAIRRDGCRHATRFARVERRALR